MIRLSRHLRTAAAPLFALALLAGAAPASAHGPRSDGSGFHRYDMMGHGMHGGMMGYGMRPGMMMGYGGGPGMMGYGMHPGMMMGYGGGPGMLGYGMHPGMMMGYGGGPGMIGYGMHPGMMMGYGGGPRMMGYGMHPGMMMGYGAGPGMMGWEPGMMDEDGSPGAGPRRGQPLDADDVRGMMQRHLERMGNPRLRLGKVEADDDKVTVDIVTDKGGNLVDRMAIDRHTGRMMRMR